MKSRMLGLMFILASVPAVADDEVELLCSKALLSEMNSKGLISSSSTGVCVESLDDLPEVSIGLGSSVYALGASSGDALGGNKDKIKSISQILTGNELNKGNFQLHGYADGRNNSIQDFNTDFLGTKTKFTKADIRKQIKDEPTKKKILDLLADADEKAEFEAPTLSQGPKSSYVHKKGVTYHKNIDRVMSLASNYYLALDRARKTCEKLTEGEEPKTTNCESKIQGHPSPNSEVLSAGVIVCDSRRKSVLVLNPKPAGSGSENPSSIEPSFMVPPNGSIMNMQVASSLDLLKKITQGQSDSDVNSVLEKLATDCTNGQTNSDAFKYNKQNLQRMYDDITRLAASATDTNLKNAILKGDYKKAQPLIEKIRDDFDDGKISKDDPNYLLVQAVIIGQDRNATPGRIIIQDSAGKKVNCEKRSQKDKSNDFAFYDASAVPSEYLKCIYNNKSYLLKGDVWEGTSVQGFSPGRDNKVIAKTENSLKSIDEKYPLASRSPTNTDVFNCLSASAAIEEKMKNPTPDGSSGNFLDPSDLVADAKGQIEVKILPKNVSSHARGGDKPERGWFCEKCHNGIVITPKTDPKSNSVTSFETQKRSRENGFKQIGNDANAKTPLSSMGLTFGSMKNLGYRKVTRDNFGNSCPSSKTVCDCLKNVGNVPGGLDGVIKNAAVIDLSKLKAQVNFSESDKKDSCFWAPPVAPSCTVAPSGKSSDNLEQGLKTKSCQALNRFFGKYQDRNPSKDPKDPEHNNKLMTYLKTFSKKSLKSLQCRNVFPSEDDSKDCPWPASGGSSGAGSKGVKQ